MSRRQPRRLAGRVVFWSLPFGALAVVDVPPPDAVLAGGRLAVPLGGAAGAALFVVLARRSIALDRLRAERWWAIASRSAYLAGRSAYEEALWRGLALGALTAALGVGAAFSLTTALFAVSHIRSQGRQALVHLVTGTVFGGAVVATGELAASIAAHATYNVLIGLGLEAARQPCPIQPIGEPVAASYDRSRPEKMPSSR